MSSVNVTKAIGSVVEYMYRNEEKSFMEIMKDGDNKLTTLYRLQHHIFYSVLMLKFNGDEIKFNEWFDEFCDDNGICEIYDDELEEYLETKCGCQIIINSREHDECRCDADGENWICADCYDGEYDESDDDETEVEMWNKLKEEEWNTNLFNSMEAFGEWFDENIKSLEDCEAEGVDIECEMKKWCENNNHDYNDYDDTRSIGVYNNNVKRIWNIKIEK